MNLKTLSKAFQSVVTMFFWRKSKKSFFEYFEEQARETLSAAECLADLFFHPAEAHSIAKKIKGIEHAGDQLTHSVIQQMNTEGFILPIDHEDILAFAKTIDDVLDYIDDSAESFAEIYELDATMPFASEFALLILEGTQTLVDICSLLKSPSQHASAILTKCVKAHEVENRADDLKKEALKKLFSQLKRQEVDLPNYLAWSEIYRTLEVVTDKIEDCANIAEQIVVKYS
ncbi:DUF47 domain-containing protein [Candidatus Protochlamydia phocaeensis]|uniref:DUF47 domain-containing protein n=1 Tax=Candidatus Protochlamydia phocaeensis TaxID=1414722 RepID=UPI0008389900|nr:DUF47 family protein [Candidatus Protochlamydia phocaeensis]